MNGKSDFIVIGAVNGLAWLAPLEASLKVVLLFLSICFLIHRWIYWSRHKDQPVPKDEIEV